MNSESVNTQCYTTGQGPAIKVVVGNITLYFSYHTVIAFRAPGYGLVVGQNVWSPTTGKHLNEIDGGDKKSRLPYTDFRRLLDELITRITVRSGEEDREERSRS